jgi:large subunit ribosomal protein L4
MSVATYTSTGTKATTAAKLDKSVFGIEVKNHELLKQAYVTYLSNARNSHATVKTRGLVSGGGRKPWKQKGTGRARFGSSRNPIWRGGGIVFGPTGQENYTKKLPTAAKRVALRQAMSMAASENHIHIIEKFDGKDGKISTTVKLLEKMNLKGNILIVVNDKSAMTDRATNNLQNVKIVQAMYVNVYDLINADAVVIDQKALVLINEWLGEKKTAKVAEKVEA